MYQAEEKTLQYYPWRMERMEGRRMCFWLLGAIDGIQAPNAPL